MDFFGKAKAHILELKSKKVEIPNFIYQITLLSRDHGYASDCTMQIILCNEWAY